MQKLYFPAYIILPPKLFCHCYFCQTISEQVFFKKETFRLHLKKNISIRSSFADNVPQLQAVKAEKQYLTDHLGTQYLDCISNIAHVGHCHPQVVAAIHSQFSRLATAQGFSSDKCSSYIKKLISYLPESLCICYLVNSGSEANDLALRLAQAYTKKSDILVFDEAYHGDLGSLIDISPRMLKELGQPKKDHVHILPLPDAFKGPYKEEDRFACEKYISDSKKVLAELSKKCRQLACFISEMFIVTCGVIVPPKSYFKQLYEAVRGVGGVCIADEAQTGLGRLGEHMWAFQYFGVTPDIVTIGKPLGNGYPMAAVITTTEIADTLGHYYSTFGGNPVACSVGRIVLDIIHNEKLMASGKAVGKTLLESLMQIKNRYDCVGDVRGLGLCIGVEIVRDKCSRKPDSEAAEKIIICLKEAHHILLQVVGPYNNVLAVTPPMCFTQQNARSLVKGLDQVLSSLDSSNPQHDLKSVSTSRSLREAESTELGLCSRRKRPKSSYDDVD